jgi:monoamine oxidase
MARTPLLRSIRQLARDVRVSKATGIPVDEISAIRAERKLTRRGFLAGAAAGAAVLAVPGRARADRDQPKITIVGGGIAGLTCALTLRDHRLDATVYEASGRLGGRMFSNTSHFAANQVTEWCGELIDTGHHTVRNLAARFSLPVDDLHAAEPNGSDETYLFDGKYYPKAQANADFLDIADILQADLDAAPFPTTFDEFTPEAFELDHMSVRDWIESRVPGGFRSPLGQLLDVAYNIEYGAETTVQAALNLIYLLAFQPTANRLDIFGESDERFHIRGGNQRLPEAIAASLGDAVVTGHKLVRVAQTPNGRYRATFERGNTTVEVVSDIVVLAIPFAVSTPSTRATPGSSRASAARSHSSAAATTASSTSSSSAATGSAAARGPARPTARATPTPATRRAGRSRARSPARRGSSRCTRAARSPTRCARARRSRRRTTRGSRRTCSAGSPSSRRSTPAWRGTARRPSR